MESVFLVKFQTKEGAGYSSWKYVNESRRTCPVADCIWEELNITNACDCNRTTKQHEGVCPFTSIVKDQIAKAKSFGIKCVSLVDINFDSFSSAKLYQQRISRPPVALKKIYNFPEKSELPKVILPVKINWRILFCGFRDGFKNLQRSEQAHFLASRLPRARLYSNVSLLAG